MDGGYVCSSARDSSGKPAIRRMANSDYVIGCITGLPKKMAGLQWIARPALA
ncbi:MAG: hypothetical protein JJE09_12715 [Bacteroidia bacterium]|nr:hypothetical protein [Bacteroidia bacterium]